MLFYNHITYLLTFFSYMNEHSHYYSTTTSIKKPNFFWGFYAASWSVSVVIINNNDFSIYFT